MAFSVAEDKLRGMDTTALVGHLAAWSYYQSVDTPQNKQFVANFKAYCKKNNLPDGEKRVTDDPMEAAYFGVYVWKQAVEKAGRTDVDAVRKPTYGQKFLAPGGEIKMDEANDHTHKPFPSHTIRLEYRHDKSDSNRMGAEFGLDMVPSL